MRRSTRRPARRSKPSLAKARKMVSKMRGKKLKKNMDTFYLNAVYTGVLTPTQGVTVSNYVAFNPSLLDGAAPWNLSNNSEFKLYSALYDKVRVNSIKVTYIPKANTFDQGNAQNDSALTLTGDGIIHTCIDRDGAVATNIARIMRYPSYKPFSVMKKFSRTYSIKWPRGFWLDCTLQNWGAANNRDSYLQSLGCFGGPMLYAENLVEDKLEIFNEPLADIKLEYRCVFQGKTSASLSLNNDGNLVVKPDNTADVYATPTFTVLRGSISGDKRYDLSGNLVSVKDDSYIP